MKVEVAEVVLENWLAFVFGPLTTDHAPAPTAGLFAASVAAEVRHKVWSGPALEVVGPWVTVTTTSSVDAVQGAFEIVHRRVYVPAPPAGVNVAVGELVLEN